MPTFAPFEPLARGTRDPAVTVRPARPDDARAVAEVAAARGGEGLDVRSALPGWAVDRARLVVVGEAGGAVVGWAMVAPWRRPGAEDGPHVSALTVHPAHRRRGVGDRLLGALTDWTWERAVVLWSVVNAGNAASLALHRRHGFATVRAIGSYAGMTFEGGRGVLLRAAPTAAVTEGEAP